MQSLFILAFKHLTMGYVSFSAGGRVCCADCQLVKLRSETGLASDREWPASLAERARCGAGD